MKTILGLCIAFLAAASLLPGATRLDGPSQRREVADSVRVLFDEETFDDLEKMAAGFRVSKERFTEGVWKLSVFYHGLRSRAKSEPEWQGLFERLDHWKQQFPNSITQPVARANALTSYAWAARGTGFADTVTAQGWKLFGERLAEARKVLEDAEKLPVLCPGWFSAMQTVALGQGWDRKEYEALFDKAVAAEPTYYDFYFSKAYHLVERWYGEGGEWERFAEEAAKGPGKEEGMTVYARIAWARSGDYQNLFRESRVEWTKMKQGFEDMMRRYPDSGWNLNSFCRFAVMAGDRETAYALFNRIGDGLHPQAWMVAGRAEIARLWADPAIKLPRERAAYELTGAQAESVAFSPDGKRVAAGFSNGEIVILDATSGGKITRIGADAAMVRSVAFSPDGSLLAAGIGGEYDTAPGLVRIWGTSDWRERHGIRAQKGPVCAVAFTPDGKSLICAGGAYNKSSELQVVDPILGGVTHIAQMEIHRHGLDALAIAPDGGALVVNCTHPSVVPWNLKGAKFVLGDEGAVTRDFVGAVAFSPDGKRLAAGCMPSWNQRERSGTVMLFDTTTWKECAPRITGVMGGIVAVAFSPDGRFVAAGGHDEAVRVWEAATAKPVGVYVGHHGKVSGLAFSPDGKTLASCGLDGVVKFWDAPGGK